MCKTTEILVTYLIILLKSCHYYIMLVRGMGFQWYIGRLILQDVRIR